MDMDFLEFLIRWVIFPILFLWWLNSDGRLWEGNSYYDPKYPLGRFPQRWGHNIRRSEERRLARREQAAMNRIAREYGKKHKIK